MREIATETGDDEALRVVETLSLDAPAIDISFAWIWRAWHRLSDDRPRFGGGMGPPVPGRIAWMTVQAWCQQHGYRQGEMDMLDACFGAMDGVYLDWWSKQQATDEAS